MPILTIIPAISESFSDIAENPKGYFSKINVFLSFRIFSPSGEPIMLGGEGRWLRCSPFAVYKYSLMAHCLAAAAISTHK
jgi:hypothetical protein